MEKVTLIKGVRKEKDDELVFINKEDNKKIAFNIDIERIIDMSFSYLEELFDYKELKVIEENLKDITMIIGNIFVENLKILFEIFASETKKAKDIVKKFKVVGNELEKLIFCMMKDELGYEVMIIFEEQGILGDNNV